MPRKQEFCSRCGTRKTAKLAKNWRSGNRCNACYAKDQRSLRKARDEADPDREVRIGRPTERAHTRTFGTHIDRDIALLFAGIATWSEQNRTSLLESMINERAEKIITESDGRITRETLIATGQTALEMSGVKT